MEGLSACEQALHQLTGVNHVAVGTRANEDVTHPLPDGAGTVGFRVVADDKGRARNRAQSLQSFEKESRLWLTHNAHGRWRGTSPGLRNKAAFFARTRPIGIGDSKQSTAADLVGGPGELVVGERHIASERMTSAAPVGQASLV